MHLGNTILFNVFNFWVPRYLSRYSDTLRAGRSGDRIAVGVKFLAPVQTFLGPSQPPVQCVPDLFPRHKEVGAWRLPSTSSCAEVEERVEIYLYSPSGPSLSV